MMKSICPAGLFALIACLSLGSAGCETKVLDPTQIGRFRPAPAVNVILDSLGVAEETPVAWESAAAPEPRDIVAVKGDYTLRSGDLVRISVFELFQEGATMVNDYVVSESGKLSIPEVGVVQAAGLTETQLEEEIRQILSPAILREPSVTVSLMHSQQRTYSILGNGVPQPGRYAIPRYDFRLTDALANAGGPMQFNVSYVYVSRGREEADSGVGPGPTQPETGELRLIEPATSGRMPGPAGATPSASLRRASPRDIPNPTEPAEPYELERERLGMIVPSAKGGGEASEESLTGAAVPPRERTISASVMPAGFRLLVPDKTAPQSDSSRERILISPSVMADGGRGDWEQQAPRSGARTEWVFRNGRWVEILVDSGADVDAAWAERAPTVTETGPGPRPEAGLEWINRNGEWIPIEKGEFAAPQPPAVAEGGAMGPPLPNGKPRASGELEWVYRDGQWVAIEKDQRDVAQPPVVRERRATRPRPPKAMPPMEAEWAEAVQTRVMKIPADKLLAGDPRYNVVIKPGDTVYVPVDIIGEFYISGNVNRSGPIGITGRPMTLKMAIAAAGGLGPLAYPKYCEVIRRLGENREEIVMVDLDKVASGEQPDFFIKPNDLINVGTHPTSRWRAVLRNAFRAAYGFGFVYDRNFAYSEDRYGTAFF